MSDNADYDLYLFFSAVLQIFLKKLLTITYE